MEALRFTLCTWRVHHWRDVTWLRALWWRHVIRWETEICNDCGRPVARWIVAWWRADDALWDRLVGDPNVVLCPRCFGEIAREQGVPIRWEAVDDRVTTEPAREERPA